MDPLDGGFDDAVAWSQWDESREFANSRNKEFDTVNEQNTVWPHGVTTTMGGFPLETVFSNPLPKTHIYTPRPSSDDTVSTGSLQMMAYIPSVRSEEMDSRSKEIGEDSTAPWDFPSKYAECSTSSGAIPPGFPVRSKRDPVSLPLPPISITQGIESDLGISDTFRTPQSVSVELSKKSFHPPRSERRRQNNTEKNYRTRIKREFENLRQALPEELAPRGGSISSAVNGEEASSRRKTMARAVSHIKSLENERRELEKESSALRAQVEMYRRWLDFRNGMML